MDRLSQLKSFLVENPTDAFLKYALTMEYVKTANFQQAEAGFRDLVDNYPDYIGTYYHFGKFLEQQNNREQALAIYERGIEIAKKIKNRHALNELQSVYNAAMGFDEEED